MARNLETKKAVTYKDVLRYVYNSEECKVDSAEGKRLKQMVEKLCLNDDAWNEDFLAMFNIIERDINEIKLKLQNKPLFSAMYKYSAETFMKYYEQMEPSKEYKNIILWQVRINSALHLDY